MPDKRIVCHNPERRPQYMCNQTWGMPVGWCNHNKHRGKLSVRQMKQHKCLAKQCSFFTRNEAHDYWAQRDCDKQRKKDKRRKAGLEECMKEEIKHALDKVVADLYIRNR